MSNPAAKSPLNSRQLQFVELVASGVAHGRAYEQAGYAAKGNAAEVNAARLLRNAQVTARLASLRSQQEKDGFLTREDIRRKRFQMVHSADTPAVVVRALLADEAKMMGYDEPEQHVGAIRVIIGGNADE